MAKTIGIKGKIMLLSLIATMLPIIIVSIMVPSPSQLYPFLLFAVFLALLLAIFFADSITKPLRKLSEATDKITRGDMHLEIGESKVEDEIGTLTNNFREMASVLNDSYEKIEETKGFLDNIVECSGDAIITTNFDNMITSWNKGAEELFGHSAEEMIGTSVMDLYPEEMKEKRLEWLDSLIKGEVIRNQRTTIFTKNGGHVNISLTLSTLKDPLGNPVGTVGVSKDITGEVISEEKLKVAIERLKEHDKLKDDFLSNVSHELRTPLTVIQGAVDLMMNVKSENLTDEQMELLKLADEESNHLNNLVGDILEASKDKDKLEFKLEKHSIEEIIKEAVDEARPQAKTKKIKIILDIKEEIPPVHLDRDQMKRAISELIENAVKFNREEGKVTLKVEYKDRLFYKVVIVSVTDTGIGIPESEINKVFEKFYQIESSTTRKYPGTGLGLAMVKNIVEFHGGKVNIKSTPGEGSEFMFTLPVERKK